MNDAKALIYTPYWLKVLTILFLVGSLAVSGYLAFNLLGDDQRVSHLLAVLTIAQMSISGIFLAMVLFFASRTVGVRELRAKSERFLKDELPDALEYIDYAPAFGPEPEFRVRVRAKHRPGGMFCSYWVCVGDIELKLRVQFNVHRLLVMPLIPVGAYPNLEALEEAMNAAVIDGAKKAGYEATFSIEETFEDCSEYYVIRLYNDRPSMEFLLDARERLYWMQDVTLMIRAFLIQMARNQSRDQAQG